MMALKNHIDIKRKYSWVIFVVIFFVFVFKYIPSGFLDMGGDSSQYIILSESLAGGNGYKAVNYPGEPVSMQYPPVFPALLVPIIYFFGRNFYILHLLVALTGALSFLLLYRIFERYGEWKIAFFTTSILIFNWDFIFYSTNCILSDIPYLAFSSAALLSALYYCDRKKESNISLFFLSLAVILAFFCRYIGFTLFLGIIVILSMKRDFKSVRFISLIFFSFLLAWVVYGVYNSGFKNFSHIKGLFLIDEYVPHRGSLSEHPMLIFFRFVHGAGYYAQTIGQILFFPVLRKFSLLEPWISLAAIAATLSGFWLKIRQDKYCVFHYYFLLYLLFVMSVCHEDFSEGARYILPILPFVVFYLLSFLNFLSGLLSRRFGTLIFSALCCLLLYFSFISLPPKNFGYEDFPAAIKNFIKINNWMAINVKEGANVFSRKPTITYFYTKHKAMIYPYSFEDNLFWERIKENKIRYIIVDEFSSETYNYLLPFIRRHKDKLTTLYRLGNSGILEID